MTRARDVANLIGSGNYSSTTFTATAGQTVFSIAHTQNFVQVFMNGLLLDLTVDYTSNGSAVTLTSGAAAGDEIEVVAYNTFSVGDALNQAAADTRYVNVTGDGMTGNLGVGGAANGTYAITSHSSGGANLRLENDGEVGFIRLEDDGDLNIWAHGDENISFLTGTGSGTTQMNIDGSGRVTKPNQPSFMVNLTVSKNLSGVSLLELTGWSITSVGNYHNTGSHFNLTNGRFTAPVAGKYKIDAGVMHGATTGDYQVRLGVNGTQIVRTNDIDPTTSHTWQQTTITSLLNLAANDYVSLFVYSNTSMNYAAYGATSASYTSFNGHLVG